MVKRQRARQYTLVVIDIQPQFMDSAKYILGSVGREMLLAMEREMAILLVEYDGQGETLLRPLVENYRRCRVATKASDGGATEVRAALRKHNLPRTWLRVCGVNTDCCVYRTVSELKNPIIEIAEKACFSNWDFSGGPANHNSGIARLAALPNVVIDATEPKPSTAARTVVLA